MLEHPRRVGALLDHAVEARTVEREADPRGQILDEGEVVRPVRGSGPGSRDRQRAERLLPRPQRDADHRAGVEPLEKAHHLARVVFTRRWEQARAPAVHDRAHTVAGNIAGAPAIAARLCPRDGQSRELVSVLDYVDDAPVGELADDQGRDSRHGGLLVERRRQFFACPAHEVEPGLPLADVRGGRALGSREPLALVLGAPQLTEVPEEGLHVARLDAERASDI